MNISSKQIINMIALGLGVLFSTTLWGDSHYIFIVMFAVFVSYCSFVILMARDSNKQMSAALVKQADILDRLVAGDFKVEGAVFAEQKDEVAIYHLSDVGLTEFKSNGSTWSGGYGGLSVRVAKGVRVNGGVTQGRSTRNPETSQAIDIGDLLVTNQRIIFTGANEVRVFDMDKVVNLEAGPNGVTVHISVSNKSKTSGFQSANLSDLTPGMAVALASAWHEGGKKAAVDSAKDMATRLRAAIAEQAKSKSK
jgi:hypothetical protein